MRCWIEDELGVAFTLYAIQVSPCDFQHWHRAKLSFCQEDPAVVPRPGLRGGCVSPWVRHLKQLQSMEEDGIRLRRCLIFKCGKTRSMYEGCSVEGQAYLLAGISMEKLFALIANCEAGFLLRARHLCRWVNDEIRFLKSGTVRWCEANGIVALRLVRSSSGSGEMPGASL